MINSPLKAMSSWAKRVTDSETIQWPANSKTLFSKIKWRVKKTSRQDAKNGTTYIIKNQWRSLIENCDVAKSKVIEVNWFDFSSAAANLFSLSNSKLIAFHSTVDHEESTSLSTLCRLFPIPIFDRSELSRKGKFRLRILPKSEPSALRMATQMTKVCKNRWNLIRKCADCPVLLRRKPIVSVNRLLRSKSAKIQLSLVAWWNIKTRICLTLEWIWTFLEETSLRQLF